MTGKDPDLDSAYALETPDDSRRLYARWARSYDRSFAEAMDFTMPREVARIFRDNGGTGPVLDAGAGTGLVAAALAGEDAPEIDALDISPEMLEVARAKGLYRRTIVADLTQPLPLDDDSYAGITSCGTFTHGHVGPDALPELLRVARSGALFVLTIKTEHYAAKGFDAAFATLGTKIVQFSTVEVPIYGKGTDPAHAGDTCRVACFRKA